MSPCAVGTVGTRRDLLWGYGVSVLWREDGHVGFSHGCVTGVTPFHRRESRGLERFRKSEPGLWLPGYSSTWGVG